MKLLSPGNGNQSENNKKAIQFIAKHIFEVENENVHLDKRQIVDKEGVKYQVCAYAESTAAFVSTPGKNRETDDSIYIANLPTLMFQQIKNDSRYIIYEVDLNELKTYQKPSICNVEWKDVQKISRRTWVWKDGEIKVFDKRRK